MTTARSRMMDVIWLGGLFVIVSVIFHAPDDDEA